MTLPISSELVQQLAALSSAQLAWLSGYAWAKSEAAGAALSAAVAVPAAAITAAARKVTVLSASQTGNARRVAEEVLVKLKDAGINTQLMAAGDFKSKNITDEDIVLLVTSTQGEGEPPEEAVPLYKFLFGKKAPNLSQLSFSVLGLGDTGYPNFCQAGKDFDAQLAKLGAKRLLNRVDCDLDYQSTAAQWQDKITAEVAALVHQGGDAAVAVANAAVAAPAQVFSKETPFSASLNIRQKITSRYAAKDVEHIEIDLTGSGIRYKPGDALGVYYQNNPILVAEILQHTQVAKDAPVRLVNGKEVSIETALLNYLDITQNTPALVKTYAQWVAQNDLREMAADAAKLNDYVTNTPPMGVFAAYPHVLAAQDLHDLFRSLTPRLYSIASSQEEVGEEVHITVGVVRFEHHGKIHTGGASGYLGERLEEGGAVRVFIEENNHFRLPENGGTPIIMIGAGTGIAPFRAFMQQREANGDSGENWLIFGNQKFTDDFLYQTEWQQYRKNGLLNKYNFAWSREGSEKVYVQHKLHEEAAEVWAWLQRGAHVYVCGDAAKMARDVELALLGIIAEQGKLSIDDADDYLNELRENKRYQRDVY
ncbi:assimilatory sulfite reductase (NADPH) flavoprotein subunit [Stenoxybacter acetivorans]|uniref:assimilatory sulfite reductase (NADPH) flavoprotein subunit n=1 Tax=Stenoxybacter acetivorans TaxID=422441 RepID=UPI00055A1AA0|nr:assimilatory sulfite reductase (NADPH) flavoprotein subunit [Stenoxybacter acetivorans]